jgi:hypothetical protein
MSFKGFCVNPRCKCDDLCLISALDTAKNEDNPTEVDSNYASVNASDSESEELEENW